METSQVFYVVEIHRFSERSKRLPPRRHIHSVHHTLQRAKYQAATLLRAAIGNEDVESVSPDGGPLQPPVSSASNYVYLDGLATGQVYSGYEVVRPGRAILGIKFRRSATSQPLPPMPQSPVMTGTAIRQPIMAVTAKPAKIQVVYNRPAEIVEDDSDSYDDDADEVDSQDSTPELAAATVCSHSTARSSISSISSQPIIPPERVAQIVSTVERPRLLGAIPELLERKGGRASVYSLPGLEVEEY